MGDKIIDLEHLAAVQLSQLRIFKELFLAYYHGDKTEDGLRMIEQVDEILMVLQKMVEKVDV